MNIIDQIKAEIERLKVDYLNRSYTFIPTAMQQLLDFIDTLQEQPVCEGLEEEIVKYLSTEWELDEDLNKDEPIYIYDCTWEDLKILARHFAQWGAEHAKEELMKKAVEGKVIKTDKHTSVRYESFYGTRRYFYGIADKQFKPGDKVRIIICKKEE